MTHFPVLRTIGVNQLLKYIDRIFIRELFIPQAELMWKRFQTQLDVTALLRSI